MNAAIEIRQLCFFYAKTLVVYFHALCSYISVPHATSHNTTAHIYLTLHLLNRQWGNKQQVTDVGMLQAIVFFDNSYNNYHKRNFSKMNGIPEPICLKCDVSLARLTNMAAYNFPGLVRKFSWASSNPT